MAKNIWPKMKADYCNGKGSIETLAKKYGVGKNTAYRHSRSEGWIELKKLQMATLAEELLEATKDDEVDETLAQYRKVAAAANNVMAGLEKTAAFMAVNGASPEGAEKLLKALLAYKKIFDYKSDDDRREQLARIKNLEKQAAEDQTEKVEIVMDDVPEEYRG